MNGINNPESVEEEGEISAEDSPSPFLSPVPETHQSLLEVPDLMLLRNKSSSTMHYKAHELDNSVILLESEPLAESELKLLSTLLMFQIWLAQAYYSNLRRFLNLLIEPECRFQAAVRSQYSPVHSTHFQNLKIICASLRRSTMDFNAGVT